MHNSTMADPVKLEIYSGIIGELRAMIIDEIVETTDEEKKQDLNRQQLLLREEGIAIFKEGLISQVIQDKVKRLYIPMVRGEKPLY